MPLNENSRYLQLMKILFNTKNKVYDLSISSIKRIIIEFSLISLIEFIVIILSIDFISILFFSFYIAFSFYILNIFIPKNFNMKEIEEAIDGDTFKTSEVNSELVITWLCNLHEIQGRLNSLVFLYDIISLSFFAFSITLFLKG